MPSQIKITIPDSLDSNIKEELEKKKFSTDDAAKNLAAYLNANPNIRDTIFPECLAFDGGGKEFEQDLNTALARCTTFLYKELESNVKSTKSIIGKSAAVASFIIGVSAAAIALKGNTPLAGDLGVWLGAILGAALICYVTAEAIYHANGTYKRIEELSTKDENNTKKIVRDKLYEAADIKIAPAIVNGLDGSQHSPQRA